MSETLRLQKILSAAGIASRRRSEELILAGRVAVNGVVVKTLGVTADPELDRIEVDGRPIPRGVQKVYYLVNKPVRYLSTCSDPEGRKTVLELVPFVPGLHPVGRLDRDTSGLLILTNDGELTVALTHPRHGVPKTYLAEVQGRVDAEALRALREGIRIDGVKTLPAEVECVERLADRSFLLLTLREGRNRQVRRMVEAVDHPVIALQRVAIGPLTMHGLGSGEFRTLTEEEVRDLQQRAPRGGR